MSRHQPWRRRSPSGRGAGRPHRIARSPPLASARVRSPYPPHSQAAFARAHAGLCTFLHDALALGTPWHLARLGTWHVRRRDRTPVESACVSRLLVVCARCACSPCLSFCSCVSDASVFGWPPWHLARPGTWHACGAVLAQMLCRHTCIAGTHALQHTLGRCRCCCGLVPIPARAGMGWTLPLNRCSQELAVRGTIPP